MEDELRRMIANKPSIRCYDGFEPSGRMHIAQGIFKAVNVNKCTAVGCEFVFWVADWFALMNDKMGGELERIQTVGKYLEQVWRAAGMDMRNVVFKWSSKEINDHADEYWRIVLDIARRNSLARIKKCCTIMGKAEGNLSAAQILYPLMQCADVFFLKADVCQLGKDQRKVNMLAREYCDMIGRKLKPVILSHHMLSGLKKGQAKMSKSDPDSAIFMEDTAEDVARKIRAAYCPRVVQKKVETGADDSGLPDADDDKNPVLDYIECIVLSSPGSTMDVAGTTFTAYADLERAFVDGTVSEEALKEALIVAINKLLDPVRAHFQTNAEAAALLETIKGYKSLPTAEAPPKPKRATPLAVAWLPADIKLPLATAQQLVAQIKAYLAANAGAEAMLVLPDWTSFTRNEVTGDLKDITAVLEYNAALLAGLGLPPAVKVQLQSKMILADPDTYWVTVIGVGRKRNLEAVGKAIGGPIETAGQVIACLMRAADAMHLDATHCISVDDDALLNRFVEEHTEGAIAALPVAPAGIPFLCNPATKPSGANDVFYLDDTDMDLNGKIKKAYCAEKEAANPVIELLRFFLREQGTLDIPRAEKDGGPLRFDKEEALVEAAMSGALHPGDAKKALGPLVLAFTDGTRAVLKKPSTELKNATTIVKNAAKKLAKK